MAHTFVTFLMSGYLSQSCINDERRIFPRSAWQLRKTGEPARLAAAEVIRECPIDGFWRLRCDIEARGGYEARPKKRRNLGTQR
jgi:hypothetical protein